MAKSKNGKFSPSKGKPTGEGKAKAGVKPVIHLENIEIGEEISEKYTVGPDMPGSNITVKHINRNTNKEDIDKPSYS